MLSAADVDRWRAQAVELRTSPGVHRPSGFSAALAASLAELDGVNVVDAGCGAGLISIAALRCGAAHVVAVDHDLRALADTAANVERLLGSEARERLSLWETSWTHLRLLYGDLTLINPPQRPDRLLPGTPADERHLHEGGGQDGLDGLRLLLGQTRTPAVLAVTTSLLRPATEMLQVGDYRLPTLYTSAEVEHDAIWFGDRMPRSAPVDVWRFERAHPPGPPT